MVSDTHLGMELGVPGSTGVPGLGVYRGFIGVWGVQGFIGVRGVQGFYRG